VIGADPACRAKRVANAAQRQLSAAPLAGVWRVEDAGRRQVPGTLRAADPWSGRNRGLLPASEGCGLSGRQ